MVKADETKGPREAPESSAGSTAIPANLGGEKEDKTSGSGARDKASTDAANAVSQNLGQTQSIAEFLETAGELTIDERQQIVDQALVMIEQLYVHLQLKRAMHAVDPVQRLRLLRLRLASLSERAFHDEMIMIYTHLRDLHTNYILPNPFRTRVAALPFRIEEFFEGDRRQYIVTEVSPIVADEDFKVGVVPTHWNGIPIDRAVELNAEREAGSNLAARHAQGLESLTNRWMGMSLAPDEQWVVIRYQDGDQIRESSFEWRIFVPGSPASGVDPATPAKVAAGLGINAKAEIQRRVRKLLFSPDSIASEKKMAAIGQPLSPAAKTSAMSFRAGHESTFPDAFSRLGPVVTSYGTFGYIRINTFNVDDVAGFRQEFMHLAARQPQNGLILDVRGNGGGIIEAGETLLQLLTPGPIDPERFSLISSPLTLKLCTEIPFLSEWKDSTNQAIETGAIFSQGFPLSPVDECNAIGQTYQGPVVLIIDANCYSTTDMFAAGFQDHGIGHVLGVASSTGAGGANVWDHDFLLQNFSGPDSPFRPLPRGTSFRVAIRRSTRVGERSGVLLEDLGVSPDELVYRMTKRDVLEGNVDLIDYAGSVLARMPVHSLSATLSTGSGDIATLTTFTAGLDRIDVFIDGRPRLTLDVADGSNTFELPMQFSDAKIFLRGYDQGQLGVSLRI